MAKEREQNRGSFEHGAEVVRNITAVLGIAAITLGQHAIGFLLAIKAGGSEIVRRYLKNRREKRS